MQQALLHKRLPILATTARDIHKKVIVVISLSEPLRVTPHDSLTNDGNVLSLLLVSRFGDETDSVFKSPVVIISYCTIVMASALTRADTGICRLAHILPLAVAVYDYGLISSDALPFAIFKLHLSAVGKALPLAQNSSCSKTRNMLLACSRKC